VIGASGVFLRGGGAYSRKREQVNGW
jgi:hypothetical protein